MAFVPIRGFEGKEMELLMGSSSALVKGALAKMTSGYLQVAAAGDNEVEYLALETKSNTTEGAARASVLPIGGDMQFEALCSTTPVQATHVGNDYDLATDANDVDLAATTDKVFHIDSIKSVADKIVIGRFNKPAIA